MLSLAVALICGYAALGSAQAGPLAPDQVAERQAFITAALEAEQPKARLWWNMWTVFFAIATPGSATLMATLDDRDERKGYAASTATAAVGLVAHTLLPIPAATAADAVRDFEGTPEARLAFSEALLRESAGKEAFTKSIWAHLGGLLVSGTAATVLWRRYDLGEIGLRNLLIGTAIGQFRLYTLPDAHVEALRAYERRFLNTAVRAPLPTLVPTPDGLMLVGTF